MLQTNEIKMVGTSSVQEKWKYIQCDFWKRKIHQSEIEQNENNENIVKIIITKKN